MPRLFRQIHSSWALVEAIIPLTKYLCIRMPNFNPSPSSSPAQWRSAVDEDKWRNEDSKNSEPVERKSGYIPSLKGILNKY